MHDVKDRPRLNYAGVDKAGRPRTIKHKRFNNLLSGKCGFSVLPSSLQSAIAVVYVELPGVVDFLSQSNDGSCKVQGES